MIDDEDTDTITVDEVKRQTVILVFSIIGTLVLIGITTMERDAATRQRAIMRTALAVKRFAWWNAERWEGLALRAGTVYNRYRD